jgi:hypothetical protein
MCERSNTVFREPRFPGGTAVVSYDSPRARPVVLCDTPHENSRKVETGPTPQREALQSLASQEPERRPVGGRVPGFQIRGCPLAGQHTSLPVIETG